LRLRYRVAMELILIAAISAGAAVVGAFVGALPNLLQSRALREEREKEHVRKEDAERYESAIAFIEALAGFALAKSLNDTMTLNVYATRFISTLRPGEAPVAAYVRFSVGRTQATITPVERVLFANDVADHLFRYLRGEVTASAIDRG